MNLGENRWDEGRQLCHRSQIEILNGTWTAYYISQEKHTYYLEYLKLGQFRDFCDVYNNRSLKRRHLCPDLVESSTLIPLRKGWSLPMPWLWSARRWGYLFSTFWARSKCCHGAMLPCHGSLVPCCHVAMVPWFLLFCFVSVSGSTRTLSPSLGWSQRSTRGGDRWSQSRQLMS